MMMSMFGQCQEMVVGETKNVVHDTLAVCGFDVYHQKTEDFFFGEHLKVYFLIFLFLMNLHDLVL